MGIYTVSTEDQIDLGVYFAFFKATAKANPSRPLAARNPYRIENETH